MQNASVTLDGTGNAIVVLRGDIDFTNSATVLGAIRSGISDARPPEIQVDLADVEFMDSSGLSVLVRVLHLAEERGAVLRVRNPSPKVLDQLHLSGLAEVFRLPEPPRVRSPAPIDEAG